MISSQRIYSLGFFDRHKSVSYTHLDVYKRQQYNFVVYIGIGLYSLSVLFSLVTLPVEFNASSRALRYLEETNSLTADELVGAKKVLRAAAMTYVASTFVALLSLLRLILIFGNRRGRQS